MVKNTLKKTAEIAALSDGYKDILASIISKIKAAQARAMSAVNHELIEVYRDIGKIIYEQQQKGVWGDSIVKSLAVDLQKDFPGMRGFSYRNLYTMRELYLSYKDSEKLQTLSAQISWSHNVALLSKCQNSLEKEFYMRLSRRNGWTYRVLIHHIENGTYEKTIASQSNFEKSLPNDYRENWK